MITVFKETLHKARLTALYAICLQIFRHIAQKSLAIRQYACGISMQSAEKSDYASYAQALCSVPFHSSQFFAVCPVHNGTTFLVVYQIAMIFPIFSTLIIPCHRK